MSNTRMKVFLFSILIHTIHAYDDASVLKEFYEALGGPYWYHTEGWDEIETLGISECHGIQDYGGEIYVDLASNNLTGAIPDSFGYLSTRFVFINLSNNRITGPIPSSINNLTSKPPNLSDLHLTNTLDVAALMIRSNALTGQIPDLSNMYQLDVLQLQNNQLSGTLPSLPPLIEVVDLSFNELYGNISNYLRNFTHLRSLSLYNNNLSGDLSFEPVSNNCTLSVLQVRLYARWGLRFSIVQLQNNAFTGVIYQILSIDDTKTCIAQSLSHLDLSFNQLTGYHIVGGSQRSPHTFKSLNYVNLASNQISGPIPTDIFVYTLTDVNLQNNFFGGNIPGSIAYNAMNLRSLQLDYNQLTGDIPASISSLVLLQVFTASNNALTFQDDLFLTGFISITRLSLASNDIHQPIDVFGIDQMPNLEQIDLSDNEIYGDLPDDLWSDLVYLNSISLSRNNLTGRIDPYCASCFHLRYVDISYNHLSGDLTWVSSLSSILSLDVSHNEFQGDFPVVANSIHFLDASHNHLSGPITTLSSSLQKQLQMLLIESNQFNGSLPDFSGFPYLIRVNASDNLFRYANGSHISDLTPLCDFSLNPFECPISWRIHTRCGASCIQKDNSTAVVVVTMDTSYDRFDVNRFIYTLASGINITESRIHILSVRRGSVIVTMQIDPPSPQSINEAPSDYIVQQLMAFNENSGDYVQSDVIDGLNITDVSLPVSPEVGKTSRLSGGAIAGIVIGSIFFVVIVTGIFFTFFFLRRRSKKDILAGIETPSLQHLLLSDVQIGTIIGAGNFGQVYKGEWNGTTIALKGIKDKSELHKFKDEILLLHNLNHPNVVRLFGLHEVGDQMYMVLEYAEMGSMDQLFRNSEWADYISNKDLIVFVYDLCNGLRYLQSQNILHRDLAARNLLIDGSGSVKISDFGLSKVNDFYDTTSKTIPYRWSAPEVIKNQHSSRASDIWSFGVVVWEIFSMGRTPYLEMSNSEVIDHVTSGGRLKKPERCPDRMWNIVVECWHEDPQKRPNISEICESVTEAFPKMVGNGNRRTVYSNERQKKEHPQSETSMEYVNVEARADEGVGEVRRIASRVVKSPPRSPQTDRRPIYVYDPLVEHEMKAIEPTYELE
ncbi:hypothetical protein PROFUN_03412 [Planoprotostelium fungivorum]|uniref:Protein kinase domain-containing protein n=1 Tax=Planoprotostelium fungivorum TaxID=1890364 RepID=A0A2P6NWG4_9EUKA|nr:hypothetical protein PROFUN_03412 [Planoprotostelium fungivorum]